MRRLLSLAATALVTCALAGCGSDESGKGGGASTKTASAAAQWGWYPADTSLDERAVVKAYVQALDRRDGARFCSVVAPWISGRFDIGGTDPDAPLSRPLRCPELVSALIGYIEDCCPPKFLGATVAHIRALDRRGDVVGVPITVTLRLEDSDYGGRTYTKALEDVVWVTRDAGAWRVAKLSRVAGAASIVAESEPDYDSKPDVEAARRAFAAEVARTDRQRRQRAQAYRELQEDASCSGTIRYPDGGKDVVDYRHPAPPSPTPQLPSADIAAVEVASIDRRICVVFDMSGEIRRGTTFRFSLSSLQFHWRRTGFSQGFEVELRADGRARVSSGRGKEGRSLSVPAVVGLDGNRLMLVVDRASFAAGRPFPGSVAASEPLDRFVFGASVTVVLSRTRHLHDDLGPEPPKGPLRYAYPQ